MKEDLIPKSWIIVFFQVVLELTQNSTYRNDVTNFRNYGNISTLILGTAWNKTINHTFFNANFILFRMRTKIQKIQLCYSYQRWKGPEQ